MSLRLIVTHPGGAHKDELLACAVLLAEADIPVERRDPEPAELDDPEVAVVDVGHRHEPERSNFDHHQFDPGEEPCCSLSLVLQARGRYEDARRFCAWLEVAEWMDCRGPVKTAKWLGIERDALFRLASPIDAVLLQRFAASARLEKGEVLWEMLRFLGQDLLAYLATMHKRVERLSQLTELWPIDPANPQAGLAAFIPREEPQPEDPVMGLHHHLEAEGKENAVVAMIYPDSRGTGYGLKRYNDHPAFDFTRVASESDVHFAHRGGFIAKTSAVSKERLRELLNLARI